jgi:hypothetical protein
VMSHTILILSSRASHWIRRDEAWDLAGHEDVTVLASESYRGRLSAQTEWQKEASLSHFMHQFDLIFAVYNKTIPVLLQIYDRSLVTRYQEGLCHLYDTRYEVKTLWLVMGSQPE